MSDPVKVSALTAYTTPLLTDVIYVVADPGGTPASKKVTLANLALNLPPVNVIGTTPSIETASGQTNTGFLGVKGKTSGELKITVADALAQTMTITALAQTSGAAALSIPDFAGVADTFVFTTLAQTLANKTLTTPTMTMNVQAIAAAGNAQGNAGAVTAASPALIHGTGADGTKGIVLPAAAAGKWYYVKNQDSANAILKVYPASGDAINALAGDAAISMAAKTACVFVALDATTWFTFPLLPS